MNRIGAFFFIITIFYPALFCKFKVYSVIILYIYMLQNGYHSIVN